MVGNPQTPTTDQDPMIASGEAGASNDEIVQVLLSYLNEAREARKTGVGARDDVWKANVDLYWGRMDFTNKASWQAKEVLPEAAMFVDRWAAAMGEALVSAGEWYLPEIKGDAFQDLAPGIRKFMDVWLARVGRNQSGHNIDFSAVFEELMKLGAMKAACAMVTWKDTAREPYVAVEVVDPQFVWLDPRGRGLYRIRQVEVDLHVLKEMRGLTDNKGQPLFNMEEIDLLTAFQDTEWAQEVERLSGTSQMPIATRRPIVLHEFLATVIMPDGRVVAENTLFVVANERFLIRGPEKNPFWHERDWLVYASLINVPLSVYGRSYMENWSSVARTFIEMTNLILDATFTSAMKAFALVPDMLEDPAQAMEGVHPNKTFLLEAGSDAKQFFQSLDLGRLGGEPITIWQALKQELREGAAFSEIALGQLPPKGDITATEINASTQGSTALQRSIARSIEARCLEPMLNLIWTTALQHFNQKDPELIAAVGEDMLAALHKRRKEFAQADITFRVRGLSAIIDRTTKLRNLVASLGIITQNDALVQALFAEVPPAQFMKLLLKLHGIELAELLPTSRERSIQTAGGGGQPGAQPGAAPTPASDPNVAALSEAKLAAAQAGVKGKEIANQRAEVGLQSDLAKATTPDA